MTSWTKNIELMEAFSLMIVNKILFFPKPFPTLGIAGDLV
jgi:hypothetical protein